MDFNDREPVPARPGRMSPCRPAGARPRRARALRGALVGLAVASALGFAGAQAASARPMIEGVWSFNGGTVAIEAQPDGTLAGTVVVATKFAQCSHPIGEHMWTGIVAQADGSYWGLHQWYFEGPGCVLNPNLGRTAWRVMTASGGAHYLLACFSAPGQSQPTISPTGATAGVSYGCFESAHVAPLTKVVPQSITLPSTGKCVSHRHFRIHLHDPKYDPFKRIVVSVGRRHVSVTRHGSVFAATINLTGLPRGAFTVRIHATTVLGHHIAEKRVYHTCVASNRRRHRSG